MADLKHIREYREVVFSLMRNLSKLMPFADSYTNYRISELLAELSELNLPLERPDPMLNMRARAVTSKLRALPSAFKEFQAPPIEAQRALSQIQQVTPKLLQDVDSVVRS